VNVSEHTGHIAKLTFDVSSENRFNAGFLYGVMRDGDSRFRDWLDPKISFVSAKYSPGLQTADMLAYEGWKALDHTVGPKKRVRKSWEVLRASGFETFSYSNEWFSDLQKHFQSGDMEQRVGFKPEDYKEWLQAQNRQHNVTNMFTFMDRMRAREERKNPGI
jgi:hypothetical protein